MSRTITVSTDVFAAIWAARQDGEDSEDAVLRRILDCETADATTTGSEPELGVYDARNGVRFPRGFTAIRKYKHKEYKAVAEGGGWVREDTGQQFPTLNQLNASIADGNENVWNGNWKYRNDNGVLRSINELRG